MTSKSILGILILFICLLSIMPGASADTETGTLSGTGYQSYNFVVSGPTVTNTPVTGFYVHNIENTAGAKSLIRYGIPIYSTTNSSGQVPCDFYTQAHQKIGSGTFGYQRLFSPLGVELSTGYIYATIDSWDVTGLSGNMNINISLKADLGQSIQIQNVGTTTAPAAGYLTFSLGSSYAFDLIGSYTYNTDKTFYNEYLATKPSGLGISGYVGKIYYNKPYPSKIFIVDGALGTTLASEAAYNSNNFTFNVPAQTIIIAAQDSFGTFHNSSTLFAVQTKNYTFAINPNPGAPNTSLSVTLTSDPPGDLSELSYMDGVVKNSVGDQVTTGLIYSDGNSFTYQKTQSGTWYRYNYSSGLFDQNMGTSTPSTFGFKLYDSGTYTMEWSLYDVYGHSILTLTPFSIGSTGYSLSIYPVDYSTGGFVSNSQVDVQNYLNGIWTNRTVTKPSDCVFPVTNGFYKYIVYAPTGSNYEATNQVVTGVTINGASQSISVPLFPKSTNDIFNTTVFVEVQDSDALQPIYGATVSIPSLNFQQQTPFSGTLSVNCTNGTSYTMTTSAGGYTTDTTYFTAIGTSQNIVIVLEKGSNAITYVTTSTPTPAITATFPVPTKGPTGNYTGFWGPFYNMLDSMGAKNTEIGPLMAGIFIFIGVFVGGFGPGMIIPNAPFSVSGVAVGGLLAFALSCAFGFISYLWIIVVMLLIVFWAVFLRN